MPAQRILGIDEAGRGAVLGPLVVGGFCTSPAVIEALQGIGVRDSKELSPAARRRLSGELAGLGVCRTLSLSPAEIDTRVARHELNELEAETFARLVREIGPSETIVDACDPDAARFGRTVRRLAGGGSRVRSYHRADRDHAIVGAASILAKVERDASIARLAEEIGEEIGSGYPGDPRTLAFLHRLLARGAPNPSYLRGSWSTVQRAMAELRTRALEPYSG